MKTLIINTYDGDGGAARSAYRLHKGLQSIGINSQMLVQYKKSDDQSVISLYKRFSMIFSKIRAHIDRLPLKVYPNRKKFMWGLAWLPVTFKAIVGHLKPEILHLHWISAGFVNVKYLAQIKQPIIWTLHDSWAFTGGCHIPFECKSYQNSCGKCPQLGSNINIDISNWVWRRKAKYWKNINLTVVTPSKWLADCARASSLFRNMRIEVIPNGLDLKIYKPVEKSIARNILNLPQDKKLILFGAMSSTSDLNKGFYYLQEALQYLVQQGMNESIEVVVFGNSSKEVEPQIGFKTYYLGNFNDDYTLALLYSAADVFVAPSIQENLSNTVMESLACGTPCVAFNIGGMPDMINHQENGYLARAFEADDLEEGISWVLADNERLNRLSKKAREKAEREYNIEDIARRYSKLYNELSDNTKKQNGER
ncbi:MAG: glycosyltransferase family 4 protein [Deltaproteobacteria bacterium]